MHTQIAQLIVHVTDLLEAEGRALRNVLSKVWVSMWLVILAGLLLLGGVALVLRGLWLFADQHLGTVGASLICGAIALGLGAICIRISNRINR